MDKKIGFIGCGNMAQALIRGFIANGVSPDHIIASNRSEDKLRTFSKQLGIQVATSNEAVVAVADLVILCVKPLQHQDVIEAIAGTVKARHVPLVTVAIGIGTQVMQKWLGFANPLFRAMPNTASEVQQGVTGLFANEHACENDIALLDQLFAMVGVNYWLQEESMISAIAAVSGSGPAYLYRFMESWVDAACSQGFSREMATDLVMSTVTGAMALAKASPLSIEDLRAQVTSPKGSTQAAIAVFDQRDIVGVFDEAIRHSKARIDELEQK